jgi:hypothetical protein
MNELEFCVAFVFLMLGFNLGFRESRKGLTFQDIKLLYIRYKNKKGLKSEKQ